MKFQIPTYKTLFPGKRSYEQKLTCYGSSFTRCQANVCLNLRKK